MIAVCVQQRCGSIAAGVVRFRVRESRCGEAPTLADLVVATRPDRYAITGGDAWGRSDAFDLVDRVPAPIDLATLRHRRVVLLGAITVLLAVLAVVGTFLLLSKPV